LESSNREQERIVDIAEMIADSVLLMNVEIKTDWEKMVMTLVESAYLRGMTDVYEKVTVPCHCDDCNEDDLEDEEEHSDTNPQLPDSVVEFMKGIENDHDDPEIISP